MDNSVPREVAVCTVYESQNFPKSTVQLEQCWVCAAMITVQFKECHVMTVNTSCVGHGGLQLPYYFPPATILGADITDAYTYIVALASFLVNKFLSTIIVNSAAIGNGRCVECPASTPFSL